VDGVVWRASEDYRAALATSPASLIENSVPRGPNPLCQTLKAIENEITTIDDRSFRWVLKKPFPKMLLALGKVGTPCCFVMPARIAATDPFKKVDEYVGSGPMRFLRHDWVPGVRSVFERFPITLRAR